MPKRGRPSSRSATRQSRVANRASRHHLYGDAVPRAGRPHVEPTDVYSRPPREGGYSARGARKGESKEGGAFRRAYPSARPPTKHAVWRRVPRLVLEASGSDTRSAQHLTPLRGRPLASPPSFRRKPESSGAGRTRPRGKRRWRGKEQRPMYKGRSSGEGRFLRAPRPDLPGRIKWRRNRNQKDDDRPAPLKRRRGRSHPESGHKNAPEQKPIPQTTTTPSLKIMPIMVQNPSFKSFPLLRILVLKNHQPWYHVIEQNLMQNLADNRTA